MNKAAEDTKVEPIKPITFDTPVKRGNTEVASITLRKPGSGELRGCSLVDLLQMDVATLQRVVPRISIPALTEDEVGHLDPADLLAIGLGIVGFLSQKASQPEAYQPK